MITDRGRFLPGRAREKGITFCVWLCAGFGIVAEAQVTAPVFGSGTSSVIAPIDVVVTCAPTGTTTYTTNDQIPTLADPTVANGETIKIHQKTTLKARTFSSSGTSSVTSAEYLVTGMVDAGPEHAVALRFDGKAFAWGNQIKGALGNGVTTSGTIPSPSHLYITGTSPFANLQEVSAGNQHTLLLEKTGTKTSVWAVGANDYGQIGDNTANSRGLPVAVLSTAGSGTLTGVKQVAAGSEFSLALESSGSSRVYSWGAAVYGRLGNNATTGDRKYPGLVLKQDSGNPPLQNVKKISAGAYYGVALHTDGTVSTWGRNNAGQLGQGDTSNKDRAGTVQEWISIASKPPLTVVADIAAGTEHVLAIRSGSTSTGIYNNAVWAWGEQQYGAMGNGQTSSQARQYAFPVIRAVDDQPLDDIVQIAAGESVSLARSSSGTVYAWGRNNTGAVGTGTTGNVAKATVINVSSVPVVWIAVGGNSAGAYCLALDRDGKLYAWGNNSTGMLGTGTATTVWSPTLSGTMRFTNQPPVGTLSLTGAPFTAPANVTLTASVTDPEESLEKVEFYQDSAFLVTDTVAPYTHTVNGVGSGTYVFGARVNDSAGATIYVTSTLGIPLPTVTVTGTPSSILENSGSSATFRISRAAQENLTNPLTVNFTLTGTAINGGDYSTVNPLSATIASGGTTASVTITPINDAYVEGSENVLMTLTPALTTYNIQTGTATITITEPLPGWIGKISGDSQLGTTSAYLEEPLVVEVRSGSGGTLLINAPVVFSVASGSGALSTNFGGTVTSGTLTALTGTNGRAQAWYRQGSVMAVTSTITAQSGSSSAVGFTSETAAGLWSRWLFNEGTGTTAAEATGAGGNGTLVNSPTWSQGFDGRGALSFTGSNSYVTMGNPTARSLDLGTGSFSLAFWVKYSEAAGSGETRRIVGKGANAWGAGYFVGLKGDGKIAAGLGSGTEIQADAVLFKTTNPFSDSLWHHVVVVMDRSNAKAQIYVDGAAQNLEKESGTGGTVSGNELSLSGLGNLTATSGTTSFSVASFSGTGAFFKGDIDDVQVHRSALTGSEVTAAYNVDIDNSGAGDGLPDRWEWKFLGTLNQGAGDDGDGDGLTNLQEYEGGSDPQQYYNGTLPVLQKLSGDSQAAESGKVADSPLVVKVMTSGSVALPNAPVTFSISGSNGEISTSGTGPFVTTQSVVTATSGTSAGTAAIYLKLSGTVGAINQVQAQVISGTSGTSVMFSATTRPGATLSIISGNNQAGPPSAYLAEPMVVEVRSGSAGALLINEPVTFTVASGSGSLCTTFGGTLTATGTTIYSGTNGRAQLYYTQSSGTAVTSTISATSGTAGSATFTARTSQADGLWAHWKFDEKTGSTAADATGLTVSGTFSGTGVSWVDGFDGRGGVEFDGFSNQGGSNSYITMGNPSDRSLDFGKGSFSISVWLNFTNVSQATSPLNWGRRIISKGHHGWNPGYFIGTAFTGHIWVGIGSSQSGSRPAATLFGTAEEFNDGNWHHVVVVFDRENAQGRIYVDGEAQELVRDTDTGGTIDSEDPTLINFPGLDFMTATREDQSFNISSHSQAYDFYEGQADDLRIYRKALSSANVLTIYNHSGDGDSMPDWWEWKFLKTLSGNDSGDADGDGVSNQQEYLNGTNPRDLLIQKVSGDAQTGEPGAVLPNPLVVKVMTSGSSLVVNEPVTFSISGTNGQIASSGTGAFGSTLNLTTSTLGTANIYLKVTGTSGAINQVQAQVTSGTSSVAATFSATTLMVTTGSLSIVSGNSQTGIANEYLTNPFAVEVRSGTVPLNNAPIVFTVTSGSGGLATNFGGTVTSGTLTVNSGTNGRASAYFKHATNQSSTVSVTSGTFVVVFSSTLAGVGPWSAWSFHEGAGTVAAEKSGEGGNGALINSPQWSAGYDGLGGIEFSGSNSYVNMGAPMIRSLDLGSASFTIGVWVKYTVTPSSGISRIVSKGYENFGPGYFVGVDSTGKLAVGLGAISQTAADAVLFKTTGSFNDGVWHHVGVVLDRANATGQIYVDGTARTLEKETGTGGTVSTTSISLAGLPNLNASSAGSSFSVASRSGSDSYFRGEVDDIEIHRKALTASELAALYNADTDGDGLSNFYEYQHGTLADKPDTDNDGMYDGWENENGLDANFDDASGDPDNDGRANLTEYLSGSDPNFDDSGQGTEFSATGLKVFSPLE
jgi:alpha-tubulin suppressor-like RCC1 family protein